MIPQRIGQMALASLIVTLGAGPALAGTVITADDQTVTSSADEVTETSMEIFLDRTDDDDDADLSGVLNFQVRVELAGDDAGSDVSIVDVGDTADRDQTRSLDSTSVDSDTEAFGGTVNVGDPFAIADGDGLMRVDLEIEPNVSGEWTLEILTGEETDTALSDEAGDALPFDTAGGTLTVESPPTTPIPEPASSTLAVLACGGLAVLGRPARRRRAANAA